MVYLTFDHFQPEIKMKVIFFDIIHSLPCFHLEIIPFNILTYFCQCVVRSLRHFWRKIWPIPCSECRRAKTHRPWIASLPQTLEPASLLGLNNCIGTAIVHSQVNSFLWLTVWKRDILVDFYVTKPSNWFILHVGFVFIFLLLFIDVLTNPIFP